MQSIHVLFTKEYFKSKSFWLSSTFVIIFLSLLTIPSFLFFYFNILDIDLLFTTYGVEKNTFPLLYHKIGELMPWVIVCLTALIVINGNTIFYFVTFNEELIDEKFQTKKYWFNLMTWLFVLWAVVSAIYLVKFVLRFTDLTTLLNHAKADALTDPAISDKAAFLFNHFITQVEYYTIITIIIFIFIDVLSRIVKNKQITAITLELASANNPTLQKTHLKIQLQKEFVTNQLFLIDIPVLIGILLISLFTSQVSTTLGNDKDAKFVFVAGGIGMHIIMSQVIFLILNLRYKFNEYKIDLPEQKKKGAEEKNDEVKKA